MPETKDAATSTPQKTSRRSKAELKAYLVGRIKALEAQEEIRTKRALERLAKEAQELAAKRPGDPKIGQAANLLLMAAAAMQVVIPQ